MLRIDDIRNAASQMAQQHGLDKVTLFGSYARGDAREDSDVDLVVETSRPLGFARGAVFAGFEQLLNRPVDIVFGAQHLYPFVRDAFESEGVVLYEA